MQTYRYPRALLLFDGLRAGFGILTSLGPLLFLDVSRILAVVLGGVAVLFLWFSCRVLIQYSVTIVPADDGFLYRGWRRRSWHWQDLRGLKLAYYAPMRRRGAGWYQLTLTGNNQSIRLESTLSGFDQLLRSAVEAADRARLVLDVTTRENLHAWSHVDGSGSMGDDHVAAG